MTISFHPLVCAIISEDNGSLREPLMKKSEPKYRFIRMGNKASFPLLFGTIITIVLIIAISIVL